MFRPLRSPFIPWCAPMACACLLCIKSCHWKNVPPWKSLLRHMLSLSFCGTRPLVIRCCRVLGVDLR
ncbi:hypothetical protein LX36DRAFT_126137 [Colletotrichum falcatum]|nr:hypothetical protein LX36DRAFT_126137 [Colletotrichum falcatum]